MVVAQRISLATASLVMLAVAVASAQAVNPNNEAVKRNLIQFAITHNSSSIHPLRPGWTGTAFPATSTPLPAISPDAYTSQAVPESHSTQATLGEPGLLDSAKTTTTPTPAIAASQNSPPTTPSSEWVAEAHSTVPALFTYPVMTNPSLSVGGPGTPTSSSQPPSQTGAAAQSTATTGAYALAVGRNGDVGLQSVSATSGQAATPTSQLLSPLIGPTGTSSTPGSPGPAAISVGSIQNGGSRPLWPLPTGFSNGTLAGNGRPGNSSDVLPYPGVATRDRSQGLSWLICMMSAALLAAL